jgi:hypothetical protein
MEEVSGSIPLESIDFEKYLKTASGMAFRNKRLI